jgi:hypothetical protein
MLRNKEFIASKVELDIYKKQRHKETNPKSTA